MLIVARCLMGFGAAFIYPTTLSIITNTFRVPHERARAIGIWAGVSGVGIALGPVLGGVLVEQFGWSAVFLINVPICATAFLLARWFVPESKSPEESPLDPIGALLSIVGLVGLLGGIIQAPELGLERSRSCIGGFAVAAIVLPTFWWWERHTDKPMLDVRVFKNPRFERGVGDDHADPVLAVRVDVPAHAVLPVHPRLQPGQVGPDADARSRSG